MPIAEKPRFTVSVRELIEFVLRQGDLGGNRDFIGSDRALAGVRGHQRIQRSRPPGYQREVLVAYEIVTDALTLRVQGRIDGLISGADGLVIDEIKTTRGHWSGVPDPLHWAQAKFYGFMYSQSAGLESVTVQLTYLDLDTEKATEFREIFSFAALAQFFQETTAIYLAWIQAQEHWRQTRDQSLLDLPFPFPRYRSGQRELAAAVSLTISKGGRLFVEAPTGIGKTISVLYPTLQGLAAGTIDQIFYLTARTVARTVAEKAFADLRQAGARLRVLTLTAKEKLCVRDGHPCDVQTCPWAIGYFDRSKPAIREALDCEVINRPVLESIARGHQVCPFELGLDTSLWVDAVIGDYNYAFDPQVYLRRHFAEPTRHYAFLIDEAHNLADRAREMFSADLGTQEIEEVRQAIRGTLPRCARALQRLAQAIIKLTRTPAPETDQARAPDPAEEDTGDLFARPAPLGPAESVPSPANGGGFRLRRGGRLSAADLPEAWLPLLEHALQEAESWLAQNQPSEFREPLLQLYFRLHAFRRIAEGYDPAYITILEPGKSVRARLFCLDPSTRLREAYERAWAVVLFSGTLAPADYYHAVLGGAPEDGTVQLDSPFAPEHLGVLVHDGIRTNLASRAGSRVEVVEAIARLVGGQRGNYLVYFPSYQYLTAVLELFAARHPHFVVRAQRPGMTEPEREQFLAAFEVPSGQTLVGFAVLGGIFGEGIDLLGERLIGAAIVGVGLPQLTVERDLIQDYFYAKQKSGFDYAYTFPGMNRVLQAIGRVIRSETDRGFVLLIDTRFAESRYRRLFPRWWRPVRVRRLEQIQEALHQFWQGE